MMGRDAVPKQMSPEEGGFDVRSLGPAHHSLSYGRVTQWAKWNGVTNEHMSAGALRTCTSKIDRNGLGDRGQQRQIDGGSVLHTANMQNACVPVDVLKCLVGELRTTESVGAEQQILRVIASPYGC